MRRLRCCERGDCRRGANLERLDLETVSRQGANQFILSRIHRVSRVLICSGKVYYDLLAAREERRADHVAIIRMEQMYPFPKRELRDHLMRYPDSADVVWVQEEPLNMGPWRVLSDFIQPMLESSRRTLRYIGRPESASPAAGSYKTFQKEQVDIVEASFSSDRVSPIKKVRIVKRRAKVEKAVSH